MVTLKEAEAAGWQITVGDGVAEARLETTVRIPVTMMVETPSTDPSADPILVPQVVEQDTIESTDFRVVSDCPEFFLLRLISEAMGQPDDTPVTPDFVKTISGEALTEEPPSQGQLDAAAAVAAKDALVTKLAAGTATDVEVQKALAEIL